MLCCVSRKSVEGSGFKRPPLVPPRGISLTNSTKNPTISTLTSLTSTTTESKCLPLCIDTNSCKLNSIIEKDVLPVLLPCTICGRTFKPQSLEKHTIICERSIIKKRKPFDSAKQRIQGTELEEFRPKEIKKRNYNEERNNLSSTSWKQTHDDFIKTIRAARGESIETTTSRPLAPIVAPGAPTRANEKGLCPTCSRQFGIKAYDRHVAWCKERVTRMPPSPTTNMAKERLDARMKYRAPALKNRRITNRDKYAPNSNLKNPPSSLNLNPKKSVLLPSCMKPMESHSPISVKQSAVSGRKIGQERNDGLVPPGPVKSRLSDRSNTRSINDDTLSSLTLLPPPSHSTHPPDNEIQCQKSLMNINLQNHKIKIPKKCQKIHLTTSKGHVNVKANDVTADDTHVINMTAQPCSVNGNNHLNESRDFNKLITWKQIASSPTVSDNFDNKIQPEWIRSVEKLDQTYLIKESSDVYFSPETINSTDSVQKPDLYYEDSLLHGFNAVSEEINLIEEKKSIIVNRNKDKSQITIMSLPKPIDLCEFSNITRIPPIHIFDDISMTGDSLDSPKSNEIFISKRLRKKMNLLRESTDSLVSSFDTLSNDNALPDNSSLDKLSMFPSIITDQRHYPFRQERRKASYWERAVRNSKNRFTTLAQRRLESSKNSLILPPVISVNQRSCETDKRPAWSNYVRRRPDFNLILKGRTGISSDYDPFLLAERQMLDLLSDTCSDQSFPDSPCSQAKSSSPHYPMSHSSAFAKYPNVINLDSRKIDKRASLIAPPMEFDDLSMGFSSDSTETNSISREFFNDKNQANKHNNNTNNNNQPILGRRIIIDKSKALGQVADVFGEPIDNKCKENPSNAANSKKINDKISSTLVRPHVNRSNSVRAASAPKIPERNNSSSLSTSRAHTRANSGSILPTRNNNYGNISGSNLSLSSIVSSEIEVKHSNSVFEDIVSSFDDDVSGSYPSLRSLLKNDSFSSPIQPNQNGQLSDEDLSSPDSYNKKEHNKLSADSAYSSLNRKYFNGRTTNDAAGKLDELTPLRRRDHESTLSLKSKMSKFCHECGTKFPETAKFCCECGVQRLSI